MGEYRRIKEFGQPKKDGRYLVKMYSKSMPIYDCSELVFREFKNGEWINPYYTHKNDGYELVGWYEETLESEE